MVRIAAAKLETDYVPWLSFTDGTEGRVNLAHLAGRGVFAAWNDARVFERVRVDPKTRTVSWPGDIDLDPDVLYAQATGKAMPGTGVAA